MPAVIWLISPKSAADHQNISVHDNFEIKKQLFIIISLECILILGLNEINIFNVFILADLSTFFSLMCLKTLIQ